MEIGTLPTDTDTDHIHMALESDRRRVCMRCCRRSDDEEVSCGIHMMRPSVLIRPLYDPATDEMLTSRRARKSTQCTEIIKYRRKEIHKKKKNSLNNNYFHRITKSFIRLQTHSLLSADYFLYNVATLILLLWPSFVACSSLY